MTKWTYELREITGRQAWDLEPTEDGWEVLAVLTTGRDANRVPAAPLIHPDESEIFVLLLRREAV